MSVKIYYAYKINTTNMYSLIEICNKLEEKYEPLLREEMYSKITTKEQVLEYHKKYFAEKLSHTKLNEEFTYHDMSICFYPMKKCTLFIPFGSFDMSTDFKDFIPYGYWNNSDPGDRITTRQWKKRESDWYNVLLRHKSNFSSSAFTKNITAPDLFGKILFNEINNTIEKNLKEEYNEI